MVTRLCCLKLHREGITPLVACKLVAMPGYKMQELCVCGITGLNDLKVECIHIALLLSQVTNKLIQLFVTPSSGGVVPRASPVLFGLVYYTLIIAIL